jgi:hypothetical protein
VLNVAMHASHVGVAPGWASVRRRTKNVMLSGSRRLVLLVLSDFGL